MEFLLLFISLILILIAAELFVNSVEWLGKILKLSEGAVGSILAAIGTALPETLIPIIALIMGNNSNSEEIGIGAILGAPLMLSTLTMFVTGLSVIIFKNKRKIHKNINADYNVVTHDLKFFIFSFTLALICGLIPSNFYYSKIIIAAILVLSYFIYVIKLVKDNQNTESDLPNLYFAFGNKKLMNNKYIILIQLILSLFLIVTSADKFVDSINYVSNLLNIPAFVLAIILTPIATELPEKFNSIIWISREKDTLALGNITGAMMFQSSILPAIGILLTNWTLISSGTLISALIAIVSASILFFRITKKQKITVNMLLTGGIFYLLFIILVITGIIR